MPQPELKTYYAKNREVWRKWLENNHAKSPGIWLIYYKAKTNKPRVAYDEAVEEALCFGWIDSTMRPIDDEKYMQRFTPRNVKSVWSALNKKRIAKLIKERLITDAGLEKIKVAKKNGSWSSIDHVENLTIPEDFQKALNKNKTALKNFNNFARFTKKQFLYRINNAKRAETRAEKIRQAVLMAAANNKPGVQGFKV